MAAMTRGGAPAEAIHKIETQIYSAWRDRCERSKVVVGSGDETALARAVVDDPSQFPWRVVDAALSHLTCESCGAALGMGPRGCDACDVADGFRYAAQEPDRDGVPLGNEHALRIASSVARGRHRYSARARCGYELALPTLLAGGLPTTADAQAAGAAINKLTAAELERVTSLDEVVTLTAGR